MRLLVYSYARGPIGGVESYLRAVVPELARRAYTVALLTECRQESAPPVPDPYAECAAEWCAEEMGTESVLDAVRAWRPDLIWTHSPHDTVLEDGLLELAPAVLFAHNYNGTCVTGTKYQRWPRPHVCNRRLGPGCAWVNFTRNCGIRNPAVFLREWRQQVLHRERLRPYLRVMVASRRMLSEIERHGVSAGRLRRLPLPRLHPRVKALPGRSGPPARILMLARLIPGKGGAILLRAAAQAQARLGRPLHLTIAGDGPERERLRTLAARLGVDAEFPGWIAAAERRQRLLSADLVAVPSVWPEPFGMVGMEGFACAVPAVAFAVGGIPDWLRPGCNGELAPAAPLSAESFAVALCRVLGDTERWQRLRRGAWDTAAEYGLDQHLDELERILHEAVSARSEAAGA